MAGDVISPRRTGNGKKQQAADIKIPLPSQHAHHEQQGRTRQKQAR